METERAPVALGDTGNGQFAVAAVGTLAYLAGGIYPEVAVQLTWVDRDGKATPLSEPPGEVLPPRVSPDGTRLAYARVRQDSANRDVWVFDLNRNVATRLTLAEAYRVPILMHWQAGSYNYGFDRFHRMLEKYPKVNLR